MVAGKIIGKAMPDSRVPRDSVDATIENRAPERQRGINQSFDFTIKYRR